tara:strand:- start:338 stop:559 length:222 start_codon:yes stop_codon:yes gene_type:complete
MMNEDRMINRKLTKYLITIKGSDHENRMRKRSNLSNTTMIEGSEMLLPRRSGRERPPKISRPTPFCPVRQSQK